METIRKLPMVIALGAAILAGILGYSVKLSNRDIMARMLLTMVVFYIVGLFLRATLENAMQAVIDKRQSDLEQALLIQKETEKAEKEREKGLGNNVDLSTEDDIGEDYNPIPVSEFIRRELGEG